MKCSLFPFLVVFSTWKRKDEDMCLFLCLVNFSNAKVIEIYVSWDLSVEPMNVRLWLYRFCFLSLPQLWLAELEFKSYHRFVFVFHHLG